MQNEAFFVKVWKRKKTKLEKKNEQIDFHQETRKKNGKISSKVQTKIHTNNNYILKKEEK